MTPIFTSRVGLWYSLPYSALSTAPTCPNPWAESRYRPLRGYYDSADPALLDAHFTQMHDAGIDFLVLDFTNGIAPDPSVSHIYAAGEAIIARNADPAAPVHMPFALAIGAQLWAARSSAGQTNEADFVLSHYAAPGGTVNPNYVQWQGKPLLVNYNAYDSANVFEPDWTDARFFVGRANPVVSTANTKLAALGSSWWGWTSQYPTFVSSDVVTVTPGADNTHRCDCAGTIHSDRNGGSNANCADCDVACTFTPISCPAFGTQCSGAMTGGSIPAAGKVPGIVFELEWLRAIKQDPSNIIIASWNDFGDETAIEPAAARTDAPVSEAAAAWTDYYGVETPDWYLQIAAGYAHLRTGLEPGGYYRDEDSTRVFELTGGQLVWQSEMPHQHPVIILPAGTLQKLGAATRPNAGIPPDGTIMTTTGMPPAMVVGGAAVRFEVTATAQHFGTFTPVTAETYESVPYAGTIRAGAPAYAAPSLPPALESDLGELWEVDCLQALTANGSHLDSVQVASEFNAFPVRGGLHCH